MRLLWIALIAVMLAGCAETAPPTMDRAITEVEGQFSGHSFPYTPGQVHGIILTNQSQLDGFWAIHTSGWRPDEQRPAPEVDFSERFIGAIFLGDKETTGYQVGIVGLVYEAGEYILSFSVGEPPAGCTVLAAPTQPNDIVVIDRVHGAGDPQVSTVLKDNLVACPEMG